MDSALLILRIAIGALLIGHGTQKLFGWFGGHGLEGTGGFFHGLGFRPGKQMAAVAGASEALGGLLLASGLLTPLAGAAIVGTMLVAASVHADKGLWGVNGGYELPLVYAVVGAAVAIAGPGSASLDRLIGLDDTWSAGIGVAAIAIGLLSGATVIARARRILTRETATATAAATASQSASAA
ncbi:MAG: DoxX family protein [Actinomycetota bacterium]|jgi:putative oxidoreductase